MIPFAANAIATLPRRLQQRLPMLLNDADKDNPRKLSFPLGGSAPPSNTWFLRPTGVLFQNGISIGSAVYCTGHRSVSQLYNGPLHYWYCVCVCVCVCVCLSVCEDISRTTRAIFTNFCACCLSPWLSPPPAGDTIPTERGNFWNFLPTDNGLYSRAFGIHTKTAEQIKNQDAV